MTIDLPRILGAALILSSLGTLHAQDKPAQPNGAPGDDFLVFIQQRPIGREHVSIVRDADGWTVRGTSQIGPPVEITTRMAEIKYDADWKPLSASIQSIVRGQDVELRTTFADGKASSDVLSQGVNAPRVNDVAADTIVLPNTFLGSYAVLAQRLRGLEAGAELRGYIAPQAEVPIRVVGVASERIDTPGQALSATRYSLKMINPPPAGELDLTIWADQNGRLLRMSIPAQTVELAREDIASAASRTTTFSLPGDTPVSIPATGFNLAGTLTKPANLSALVPGVVLIGGSGPTDRDENVFGIPIFGQLAGSLVDAGFAVVRYDKRGIGQSGGRAESATLSDYAEDARAVVRWLEKQPGIDKERLAIVGHSEGAAVAMLLSSREDDRVKAVVLIAGPATTGAELILEQQRHALDLMKVDDDERAAKIAMQQKIQDAVIKGAGWEEVPDNLRKQADTPWFHSLLSFDPARVMRDVEQPLLIVQGELDTQVPPHHADKLAELARARKRKADVQVLKVAGVNHLLVPARTGEVSEYSSLGDAKVSPEVTGGIAAWLTRTLGEGEKQK